MNRHPTSVILGYVFVAALTGCGVVPTQTPDAEPGATSPVVQEPAHAKEASPSHPNPQPPTQGNHGEVESAVETDAVSATNAPEVTEIPIPEESLYPLLEAEFALRQRDFDRALELLLAQSLKLNDPELTRRALQLAEFRKRDDAALALSMRLTQQDPDDAAAASTAMALLIRSGSSEQAIDFAREAKRRGARINAPALLANYKELPPERQRSIERAIESLASDWPDDVDIAIAMALVKRESRDLETALVTLKNVLDSDPDEERALVLWTQIQLEQSDPEAFERIEQAVDRQPENETLRLQYARLLAASEDIDGAREQFNVLQSMSPRNGDYLFSLALIELEAKNAEEAETNLRALIDLGQRVDEAHYYLGRIAEDRGDTAAAVASFSKVGPSREFFDATRRAADLLLDDGDSEGYGVLFDQARQSNPGQAERLYALQADLLRERENIDGAIAAYTEALDLFPESMPLQYGRAMAFEEIKNIAAMEADLRAILQREPNNATTLNALGYTLTVHTERFDEAAALIERALSMSPGDPAILDSLGWVYFKLGRYVQAVDLLKEAYAKFPDAEVAAHLGETLWSMGRTEEATSIWQDALSRQPDSSDINETLERLGITADGTAVD